MAEEIINKSKPRYIYRFGQFCYRYNAITKAMAEIDKQIDDEIPLNDFQLNFFNNFRKCYEFGWKFIKDYMKQLGHVMYLPRDMILKAYELGVLPEKDVWLNLISDMNLYTEIPLKNIYVALYYRIKEYYYPEFTRLKEYFDERSKDNE